MYKEIDLKEIEEFKENSILIVTATDLETKILHENITPLNKGEKIFRFYYKEKTFYLGRFGNYICFHIQCGTMGSIGISSSIVTIKDSLTLLKSKITIMIGIAYGIDEKKQKIGDVLIAESIIPYDYKKVTPTEITYRATPAPTSKLLLDRLKNIREWEYPLKDGNSKKIISPIFSGEELINNIKRRKEIQKINSEAKGGEMEGAGLYAAANGQTEWILVKGICDFADGNKDTNKDQNQRIAMNAATSLCLELFNSKNAFESINLYSIRNNKKTTLNANIEKSNILFDIYDIKKEKYYLERNKDLELISALDFFSIWISGKSGRGKSVSIVRNLIINNIEYIPISLANCINLNINDFFYEIYLELTEIINPNEAIEANKNFRESVKNINKLLEKKYKEKIIIIVIDEIPLGNDDYFKEFVKSICSLFISSNLKNPKVKIKYILSSIHSPEEHIPEYQTKVKENINFICYENWDEKELNDLLSILEGELLISIPKEKKEKLVKESKGSPRWIKNVIKNIFILGDINNENIDKAIARTNEQKIM